MTDADTPSAGAAGDGRGGEVRPGLAGTVEDRGPVAAAAWTAEPVTGEAVAEGAALGVTEGSATGPAGELADTTGRGPEACGRTLPEWCSRFTAITTPAAAVTDPQKA